MTAIFAPPDLDDFAALPSPALVIDRARVTSNLANMVGVAGEPGRLRPHAKTHKMAAMIALAHERGIGKHKVATLAEAEMVARAGGRDILIGYPLVGPNVTRLVALMRNHPEATLRAVVDEPGPLAELAQLAGNDDRPLPLLVDLDVGMGRTGTTVERALELYEQILASPGLAADGIHAYDGHLRDPDPIARGRQARESTWGPVLRLAEAICSRGWPLPRVVLGGTPTFPTHAQFARDGTIVECSPGTVVFHDHGYATRFPDLPFLPAAWLLTRVVSRPGSGRLTLDLGHKAVAADPAGERAFLPALPGAKMIGHSEEHLVLATDRADEFPPGTPLWALPVHVCPTVALHERAAVVSGGQVVAWWEVSARGRRVTGDH